MLSSGSSVGIGAMHSMNSQAAHASYSNDRASGSGSGSVANIDIEYASDPASGGFFHADYKK